MSSRKGKKHKGSKRARGDGERTAKSVTVSPAGQSDRGTTVFSCGLAGSGRGDADNGSMSDTPPPEETGIEYQSSEGSFAEGAPHLLVCCAYVVWGVTQQFCMGCALCVYTSTNHAWCVLVYIYISI